MKRQKRFQNQYTVCLFIFFFLYTGALSHLPDWLFFFSFLPRNLGGVHSNCYRLGSP